jgi:hypothetical protein
MTFAPEPDSLGSQVFESDRAEHEHPWIEQVFVEPPEFRSMAGRRSIIVFGESGSGLTALRMALARRAERGLREPHLVVDWRPNLPMTGQSGSDLVSACMLEIFNATALALLRHICQQPDTCEAAPEWVRDTVVWFVHQYLLGDRAARVNSLAADCPPQGVAYVRGLVSRSASEILPTGVAPTMVIAQLSTIAPYLKLSGIWILVDGISAWLQEETDRLGQILHALTSTLTLFEHPGVLFKLVAPSELLNNPSSGIIRRRLDVYRLNWHAQHLKTIVERRLAAATGRADFELADLCDKPQRLEEWLQSCGGNSPRGWLELVRPLAQAYLAEQRNGPFTLKECATYLRSHPPMLHIDVAAGRVFIGLNQVILPTKSYQLLRYLYVHRRICTRSELYYLVCRDLKTEPHAPGDKSWEEPKDWNSILDNTLWRLRAIIELDPKTPLYVYTKRRSGGIWLDNAW